MVLWPGYASLSPVADEAVDRDKRASSTRWAEGHRLDIRTSAPTSPHPPAPTLRVARERKRENA